MACRLFKTVADSIYYLDCGFPDDDGAKPEYTASFLNDRFKEVVADCTHLAASYLCHAEDGFRFDGRLIEIPDSYRNKTGKFVCSMKASTCNLQWPPSEKNFHGAHLESNGNLSTTTVVVESGDLSPQSEKCENQDNAALVAGLIATVVVLVVFVIILAVTVVMLFRKWRSIKGYHNLKTDKMIEEGQNKIIRSSDRKKIPIDGHTNKNSSTQPEQLNAEWQNLLSAMVSQNILVIRNDGQFSEDKDDEKSSPTDKEKHSSASESEGEAKGDSPPSDSDYLSEGEAKGDSSPSESDSSSDGEAKGDSPPSDSDYL